MRLCSFFRTHVKDLDKLCSPLNKATRKASPYQKSPITGEALETYMNLKSILCSELVMAYPAVTEIRLGSWMLQQADTKTTT